MKLLLLTKTFVKSLQRFQEWILGFSSKFVWLSVVKTIKTKCIFKHYLYEPLCPDLSYRFLSEHAWLLSYADLGGDPDPFPLWKFQICKMCIVKLLKIGLGPPPCKHRYLSVLHLEKNSGSAHVYVSI